MWKSTAKSCPPVHGLDPLLGAQPRAPGSRHRAAAQEALLIQGPVAAQRDMTTPQGWQGGCRETPPGLLPLGGQSSQSSIKANIFTMAHMASGPITSWQMDGETMETVTDFILGGSKITANCSVIATMKLKKTLAPCKKSYDQPRQHVKKQRHYFAKEGPSKQSSGFSSSHVWM